MSDRTRRGAALVALVLALGGCKSLPPFNADLGRETSPMGAVRVPYAVAVSYFGYVQTGTDAADARAGNGGKKTLYLYLWLPDITPELGIRMLSPVAGLAAPTNRDFVEDSFRDKAATDPTSYFDPWIALQRCLSTAAPEDIAKPCGQWVSLGDNDDSAELPPQPGGERHNALLRVASGTDDPLKVLARGMYRIAFGTRKGSDMHGTFLTQLGAPIELHGVAMARTTAELQKLVATGR